MKMKHLFGMTGSVTLAVMAAFAPIQNALGQAPPQPFQLQVVPDAEGAAVRLDATTPGYRYELEASASLASGDWTTALGFTGFGQPLEIHVVDIEPPAGWPGGNPPVAPPSFSFTINPFPAPNSGQTLVGFTDAGNNPVQVLVNQDWFALTQGANALPQLYSLDVPDGNIPPGVAYTLFLYTRNLPWQADYSSLPNEAGTAAVNLVNARAAVVADLANPQPPASQGGNTTAAGPARFFRMVEIANYDTDGDGLFDWEELAAGTDFYDQDTDGDGYNDKDELANGSGPLANGSRPFDPHFPPVAADWYVDQNAYATISTMILAPFQNGTAELPFATVQQALNAAAPGDVVEVAPGNYAAADLSGADVKLHARDGRDRTSLVSAIFGAGNTTGAVVAGFSISAPTGRGVTFNGGGVLANCSVTACPLGAVQVNAGGDAVIVNSVLAANGSAGVAGSALRVLGGGFARLDHCTLDANSHQNGGGTVNAGAGAVVALSDCIVWRPDGTLGAEIATDPSASVTAAFCDIRGGFVGLGNYVAAPALGADHRLLGGSPCLDRDLAIGLTGFRFFSRYDWDTEARNLAFGSGGLVVGDTGADERTQRLTFPLFDANGAPNGNISQVDEASGAAFLGARANGNALIAVIDDEEDVFLPVYEISAATGDIVASAAITITNTGYGGDAAEMKDLEGITFDGARTLYLTTSHSKRNRYRDVESTGDDPNGLPPSGDYDRRRNQIVTVTLPANFLTTALTSLPPGATVTHAESENVIPPASIGYDPADGLGRFVRTSLAPVSAAFPAVDAGETILIARGTSPVFGAPVNGSTYTVGNTLPGGGTVVTVSAAGSFTDTGRTANTTYFYKVWPVDLSTPTSPAYGSPCLPERRPVSAVATTNGRPALFVNEMQTSHSDTTAAFAALPDWVEIFNPSNSPVNVGGMQVLNSGGGSDFLPVGLTIPAGGYLVLAEGWSPLAITEIHYNPPGGADTGEFVEILNRGTAAVNLNGYTLTMDDALGQNADDVVIHTFGSVTIQPGARLSVGFTNVLDNGGERTKIKDNIGATLFSIKYDDVAPWPTTPDGGGTSLVLTDPYSIRDEDSANRWLAATPSSNNPNPGEIAPPAGAVFAALPFQLAGEDEMFTLRTPTVPTQVIATYAVDAPGSDRADGRIWDGGPAGTIITAGNPLMDGAKYRDPAAFTGTPLPCTPGGANHAPGYRFFRATANVNQTSVSLRWAALADVPAVWQESPKHHDGHAANIEGLAYRAAGETVIACRSPLSIDRLTGDALLYRVTNLATFLNYPTNADPAAIGAPEPIDLRGQGVRSIEWIPQLVNGAGRYLIIGGPADGGPLEKEVTPGKFSLYAWNGVQGNPPQLLLDDLKPYAKRPEGVEVITVNGQDRVLFTEDRFLATGYAAKNAIHWPIAILGGVQ